MFKKWFSKTEQDKPQAPEIMGLYLGGSFELDELKLRLIVPDLMIDAPTGKQIIQAVGEAPLDSGGKMLRFYTDDDAFLQVILDGGDTESHITDVKLWYFYDTKTVGNDAQWQSQLSTAISQPEYQLDGYNFTRVWDAVGEESPPIAVTETTYEEDGDISTTDQFMMLYERVIGDDLVESLLIAGEEKIVGYNADRSVVISTGIDIQPSDIKING
jgi:hypothetical protein